MNKTQNTQTHKATKHKSQQVRFIISTYQQIAK